MDEVESALPAEDQSAAIEDVPPFEAEEEPGSPLAPAPAVETREPVKRLERKDFQPASPVAVSEAIDEVNRVITQLKQVLDTMEEILETLELAEVQKTADEREIQYLRNALRQFDRPVSSEARRDAPRREERRHGRR